MPRGAGRDLNLYLYDKSERGWEDRKYTQTAKQSERNDRHKFQHVINNQPLLGLFYC
jgi:hypothetical protein